MRDLPGIVYPLVVLLFTVCFIQLCAVIAAILGKDICDCKKNKGD